MSWVSSTRSSSATCSLYELSRPAPEIHFVWLTAVFRSRRSESTRSWELSVTQLSTCSRRASAPLNFRTPLNSIFCSLHLRVVSSQLQRSHPRLLQLLAWALLEIPPSNATYWEVLLSLSPNKKRARSALVSHVDCQCPCGSKACPRSRSCGKHFCD